LQVPQLAVFCCTQLWGTTFRFSLVSGYKTSAKFNNVYSNSRPEADLW